MAELEKFEKEKTVGVTIHIPKEINDKLVAMVSNNPIRITRSALIGYCIKKQLEVKDFKI